MSKINYDNLIVILIITITIILVVLAGYMTISTKMSIADHMNLHGWEYWWYVLSNT